VKINYPAFLYATFFHSPVTFFQLGPYIILRIVSKTRYGMVKVNKFN